MLSGLCEFSQRQKSVILACYLGWMLDAFDFFILVFVLKDIAAEFGASIKDVTLAITLTLAMRPVGALLFGSLADRFGRRPLLMINILSYSLLEFASGFAPSLSILVGIRALFGVAMGGEWGVGASLTLETIPASKRGLVSGILQAGYPSGYLLASVANFALHDLIGWRGLFMIGIAPALLVVHIRRAVEESPSFQTSSGRPSHLLQELRKNWGLFLWAVAMMACFNFFSHGTQDLYPTFLQQQRGLSTHEVSLIAIIYNIGAILGGLTFGMWSNRIGRKKAIMLAALLALPVIPVWTLSTSLAGLAIGSFLIQFFVQGAWGVVPAHLNELSPDRVRGAFPGFAYQLGNLIASSNATLQAGIAAGQGGDYARALALVVGVISILLVLIVGFGREAAGKRL